MSYMPLKFDFPRKEGRSLSQFVTYMFQNKTIFGKNLTMLQKRAKKTFFQIANIFYSLAIENGWENVHYFLIKKTSALT